MFFQVHVTPEQRKRAKVQNETNEKEKEKKYTLVLAPFQPQTRIELETFVNTTTQCCLDIKNISNKPLTVKVTKCPAPDRVINLSDTDLIIRDNNSACIFINWSPKEAGSWRDIIQLQDSRRIKYDIAIIATAKEVRKECNKRNLKKQRIPFGKSYGHNTSHANHLSQNGSRNSKGNMGSDNSLLIKENSCIKKAKNTPNVNKERAKENIFLVPNVSVANRGTYRDFAKIIDSSIFNLSVLNETMERPTGINIQAQSTLQTQTNTDMDLIFEQLEISYEDIQSNSVVQSTNSKSKHFENAPNQSNISFAGEFTDCSFDTDSIPRIDYRTMDNVSVPSETTMNDYNCSNYETPSLVFRSDKNETFDISCSQICNNLSTITTNNMFEVRNESPVPPKIRVLQQTKSLSTSSDSLSPLTPNKGLNIVYPNILTASSPIAAGSHFNLQSEIIMEDHQIQVGEQLSQLNKTQTIDVPMQNTPGICIEISPPKKDRFTKVAPVRRISPTKYKRIGKDRHTFEPNLSKKLNQSNALNKKSTTSVPTFRITNLSLKGLIKKNDPKKQSTNHSREMINKTDESKDHLSKSFNPKATVADDPFLASTLFYDDKWICNQELRFKKWLNTLLSPPEDLSTDVESATVDIANVWQLCKQKADVLAETKEAVSARYHTDTRLNTLRKAAGVMFQREEVRNVFARIAVCIDNGILNVRLDRDLHRDIGLQKELLELFLSYNPLWLRIGLETVYGEIIPLRSNNDLVGLTRFLLTRFFTDPLLLRKHPHAYFKNERYLNFITQMNRFMLRKFLLLVYFLDYAKTHKLIGHDPCLFHKKSAIKTSRSILLTFSREVLSGIGDLTKVLRSYNYVVSHEQTQLEEFNYAVTNLSTDLRDGVRLCRVMELITGSRNVTRYCRVPAISRLQKIHNVDVALKALLRSNYTLTGDISAKNIVDGHREKTLSLLWQIVYKYQVPRFEKAACTIQKWWRAKMWFIRVRNYLRTRKHNAALVIQRAWRQRLSKLSEELLRAKLVEEQQRKREAARKILIYWRQMRIAMHVRRRFLVTRCAVITLQRWWRGTRQCLACKNEFRNKRNAVIAIQQWWLATKAMAIQRNNYILFKQTVIRIQVLWRITQETRTARKQFLELRSTVLFVQTRWRANRMCKTLKQEFQTKRQSAVIIQRQWRAFLAMRVQRNSYAELRDTVIKVQLRWRANKIMKVVRAEYLKLKLTTVLVQTRWRSLQISKAHKQNFQNTRQAVIVTQQRWRAMLAMRTQRNAYVELKSSVIKIQKWWRATREARIAQIEYSRLKSAVIFLQNKWRSLKMMRIDYQQYRQKLEAIRKIQKWWRNILLMKHDRKNFLTIKHSVKMIERRRRAILERRNYLSIRRSIIVIQKAWRQYKLKKNKCQSAAITIQTWWRSILSRREETYAHYNRQLILHKRRPILASGTEMWTNLEHIKRVYSVAIIEDWWLKILEKKIKYKAAALIQAAWRGYKTRQREHSRISEVRRRCYEATKAAQPTATLAHRWQECIEIFIRTDCSVGQLSMCLISLDTITRLSPKGCISLCHYNLVEKICDILEGSNRSLPWMKVCLHATSILITLAKFSPTRSFVCQPAYSVTITQLLNYTLDKDKDLFLYAATLKWLLIQDKEYLEAIVQCSKVTYLLRKTQEKFTRKKLTNKVVSNDKIRGQSANLLPSTKPDWGMKQKNPRTFTDVNFALTTIMKRVNIK